MLFANDARDARRLFEDKGLFACAAPCCLGGGSCASFISCRAQVTTRFLLTVPASRELLAASHEFCLPDERIAGGSQLFVRLPSETQSRRVFFFLSVLLCDLSTLVASNVIAFFESR